MFELFGIFISVRIWRTPCKLLAYPQGYAYPRLRIADLEHYDKKDFYGCQHKSLMGSLWDIEKLIPITD
jgi:hypothetical protein